MLIEEEDNIKKSTNTKKAKKNKKTKMSNLNLSIITLNMKGLNTQRLKLSDWITQ